MNYAATRPGQPRGCITQTNWITEHPARLREKAHCFRVGHTIQSYKIRKHSAELPVPARRKAAGELAALYKELRFDERLGRLDLAVASWSPRYRASPHSGHLSGYDSRRSVA